MKRKSATERFPKGARIIEFGLWDGALGEQLLENGYQYLGVVDCEQRRERIARTHSRLSPHLAVSSDPNRIRQNNADVLVLAGATTLHLRRFRDIRHVQFVACPFRNGPLLVWTVLFWLAHFLIGRIAWPRTVQVGKSRLVAFRVRRPKPYTATRRFIPHELGLEGFFRNLRAAGKRHVVLRWFESLPRMPAGEDLDLIVDDEGLPAIRELLDSGPGLQAIDLYSAYGAPGADYRKLPYYPPYLAEQLLDRSTLHGNLCHVPSPGDHFLSLAYHALYHKGLASGLPIRKTTQRTHRRPEHDYVQILARIAQELGISVPITLEDLDAWLDSQGWRPPHDMLVRLSRKNKWLRTLVQDPQAAENGGLAVFLMRREALARGGVKRAAKLVAEQGFQIIETIAIEEPRIDTVARSIRGGNWGKGPWPKSGGPPVAAIVVNDPAPIRPTRRQRRKYPYLANARLLTKNQIRDAFNDNRPAAEHCNIIHSSDNGREARDYLHVIVPDRADEIVALARDLSGPQARAA